MGVVHAVAAGAAGAAVAVAYADLDNFKSYNDRYGFLRGDEVISLFAQVLRKAAQDAAGPDGFVGHIGGDDFVALVPPEAAEVFAARVITGFDDRIPTLYDPEDASAGSIELEDRQGQLRRFPIVSVSLGVGAVFLFGGLKRSDKPMRMRLEHGDVVVWGGPARLRYHGVLPLEESVHPLTGALRFNLTFRKAA